MSDLVETLRRFAWVFTSGSLEGSLTNEAAAEIERLTAALATARNDALEEAASAAEAFAAPKGVPQIDYDQACWDIAEAIRALKGGA